MKRKFKTVLLIFMLAIAVVLGFYLSSSRMTVKAASDVGHANAAKDVQVTKDDDASDNVVEAPNGNLEGYVENIKNDSQDESLEEMPIEEAQK